MMASLWRSMTRLKSQDVPAPSESKSPLARVLSTLDLTALGVGSTLGVGVYVLAGSVARDMAGPAVILSFAVAALASLFAGLCYAEFGARVPLAGSAYIYTYVSIGEFLAFIIGWNLIMEYVIGCASVARGLSNYLDQLMDNAMQNSFERLWHIHVDFMSPYFDFFAFGVSFILSVVLAFGVKESMALNNLFTLVNMSVVLFVIVAGSFKADISNWEKTEAEIPPGIRGGDGGFFPYGVMGVLRGAATCFYGFIGFDCIATTGEEVRNPQKAIPLAIIISLGIIFLSYVGVSAVLTLMWPYYLQDADAPLPYVFEQIGWPVAQWIVAIGGIFGLLASLFGAMYPLPRVIYAMATDGLLFRFLGEVHQRYKTPLTGTLLAGLLTGFMSALFKLQQLVNMLSIGTLMAYTIVATCVLVLRYKHELCEGLDMQVKGEDTVPQMNWLNTKHVYQISESDSDGTFECRETTHLVTLKDRPTPLGLFYQLFNWHGLKSSTPTTSCLVHVEVAVYCCLSVALGLCLVHMENGLQYGRWGALTIVCILGTLLLLVILSIALQPMSKRPLAFKVPLVPVIPAVSITLNIYLMLMLDLYTWIRFAIWMAVGMVVYFITFPCRKLRLCCNQNAPEPSLESEQEVETPSSVVIGNRTNSVEGAIPAEAAQRFPDDCLMENTLGMNINNVSQNLTNFEVENVESPAPVEIRIQTSTPEAKRHNSGPDNGENTNSYNVYHCEMKERQCDAVAVVCCGDVDRDNVTKTDNDVVQGAQDEIVLHHADGSILDFEGPEQEFIDADLNDSQCETIIKDQISCEEINPTSKSPVANLPKICSTNQLNSCDLVDHASKSVLMEDDNESQCDVRSLYPNVVVISSSEEDVCSEFSFSSAMPEHVQITENTSLASSILTSGQQEFLAEMTLAVNDQSNISGCTVKSVEDTAVYHCASSDSTTSLSAETETLTENDLPLSNILTEVSGLKTTEAFSSEESETTEEETLSEDSTPLKSESFVEKLKKIIQDQAKSVNQEPNKCRRSYPLSKPEQSVDSYSQAENQLFTSLAANNQDSELHSLFSNNLKASYDEGGDNTANTLDNIPKNTRTETNNMEEEDIRIRLERIFSTRGKSQVSSTMKNSTPYKALEKDGNVEPVSEISAADDNMIEMRRRMANVLGTIRQRNGTSNVDVRDLFSQKTD